LLEPSHLEAIEVVALGASTAVGRDAWSTAAAVRAGVSGFMQHPYMIDGAGEPMRAAIVPWLEIGVAGTDRLAPLLQAAVAEALAPLPEFPLRIGLALALPAPRPGLAPRFDRTLLAATHRVRQFDAAAVFQNGHAAGFLALEAATEWLAAGTLDACVVAGVDSYIDPVCLEWLEEQDQLHGAGALNNAWGFIPGEGAGAVVLMHGHARQRFALPPLARLLSVATATELKRIKTETVGLGEGLTSAFRKALAGLPTDAKVTDVYCDMNGEPYRADEYGFTALRTKEFFASLSDFVAPADCWGDVGAASAPLHAALAVIAGAKRYANGRVALAWASSEAGERGAAVLQIGAVG
jgi:3-oxoacyl-[acyl-carrier-protein] synthase I